jgi:hypothetical protein
MTAAEILREVRRRGVSLKPTGRGTVRLRGPAAEIDALIAIVGAHKAEVIDELRKREIVLVAARLLRECRWAVEPPVCDFHTGKAGEHCRRCGASWIEHYPAPADGAAP